MGSSCLVLQVHVWLLPFGMGPSILVLLFNVWLLQFGMVPSFFYVINSCLVAPV